VSTRHVTLMVVPDDNSEPKKYRLPKWLFRTLLVFLAIVIIAPIIYISLYYEVLGRAAEAGRLAEENESLRKYLYKVQNLEQELLDTRQLVAQMATMAGLDSILITDIYEEGHPDFPAESRRSPGSLSRTLPPTSPIPDGLPVTGWITRGYSEIPGKKHYGVDLAVPTGTPVFSTAFGTVTYAGLDDDFGKIVIVQNNDSIETVYGHNSELLVQVGDTIFAGQRVALSGNTGRSSAPHLHYEIRIHGKPVNPMKFFVYED